MPADRTCSDTTKAPDAIQGVHVDGHVPRADFTCPVSAFIRHVDYFRVARDLIFSCRPLRNMLCGIRKSQSFRSNHV